MTVGGFLSDLASWDVKMLCTDIDTEVLATAKRGRYDAKRIDGISDGHRRKWLTKVGDQFEVSSQLKRMMIFKPLNLMNAWPMQGKFDLIFCRNVVIYFDKPTQRVLMDRYADILEDHGRLIIGHSESMFNVSDRFTLIGQTTYKKVSRGG